VRQVLIEALSAVHSVLQDGLVGMYLYGSLAMGCFNPRSSDIDVIVVTRKRLSKGQRKRIIEYLKESSSRDRRMELSIVSADAVRNPQYPMMVDVHYEYWGNIFENKKDKEILSNLYTTRRRGFRVWGTPISRVFSKIPAGYHLRAVKEDIEHTRKYLHVDPKDTGYNVAVYWVLGSCRILAFIREGRVLSKLEGGRWGLANLPEEYHDLIEQAVSCYQGDGEENGTWKREELGAFAGYMVEIIREESKL
jgi:streptomycin 3"-adenylyltransferase